jgi:hypothetical protein
MPSSADRVALRILKEASYKTLPGSPVFAEQRYTAESLKQDTGTTRSAEIREDRQDTFVARTSVSVSGSIDGELSHDSQDSLIISGLQGDAFKYDSADTTSFTDKAVGNVVTVTATDISAAASDNSLNTVAEDFTATNGAGLFNVGQWVRVRGFTGGDNRDPLYGKIVSVAATKIVLSHVALVDDAAGESVTIEQLPFVENGTTLDTYSVEREYKDLSTNPFTLNNGCGIEALNFGVSTENIVTISASVLGATEDADRAATASSGGTPTAAPTTEVYNAVDNVVGVFENGATACLTDIALEIANNLRQILKIGNLGATALGVGKFRPSGSITFLNDDGTTHYGRYLNFTTTSFALIFEDAAGNSDILELPAVKFTDGSRNATGENSDVVVPLSLEAFRHPTEGITMRFASIDAA